MVGLEGPNLEVPPELILLTDVEWDEGVLELGLVHGAVHVEQPPDELREVLGDEDGGRAEPVEPPRGHVHGEAPDVVEVGVGDEEEVLRHGALRAPPDVEGEAERREDDAGLLPADRDALHGVPLDLQPLLQLRLHGGGGSFRRRARGGRRLGRLAALRHGTAAAAAAAGWSRGRMAELQKGP